MAGKNMRLGINMNFDNVREDSPQFQCVRDKVDFMVAHTDPYHAALPVNFTVFRSRTNTSKPSTRRIISKA